MVHLLTSPPVRLCMEVRIPVAGGGHLEGTLTRPAEARGLVLFAHGSGSGRRSPRNLQVASALQDRELATLRFDLLTPAEAARDTVTGELRFNIPHLTLRLLDATRWSQRSPFTCDLPLGFFGASTGAAAALALAAELGPLVRAVVSRGGRPDLARGSLAKVETPTLLIVGERDAEVLALHRSARRELRGPSELHIVPGATHLFEEPGALDEVAREAAAWFIEHFTRGA